MKNLFIKILALTAPLFLMACGQGGTVKKASADLKEDKVAVGFIYVGSKDDFGYNQSHSLGAAAIGKLDGVTILEEENVQETMDVQKTMESMINMDGVSLIFPTSFGYFDPHVLAVAKKYPQVNFLHCGGLYDASKHPENVGSYFGYIDEAVYIGGIVAGHTSKTKKLGYIAAKPIPQVLRNINAFALGARSVDPTITVTVIFTGDWFLPVREAEAANSLIDKGIDVLTGHIDSPKVLVETAEKRGVYAVGYHTDQSALASKGYLTGAVWNWPKVYSDYLEMHKNGQKINGLKRGGLKEGLVLVAPYGPAVSEKAKTDAEAAKSKFFSENGFAIFQGPLTSNKGTTILKAGEVKTQTDPDLEAMDYLVEGVIGEIPSL